MGLSARQVQIADAAVAIVARGGARALTHRAVDREAGLAAGSTSFYARTRRDLVQLAVQRIIDVTQAGLDELTIPDGVDLDTATDLAADFLEHLARQTAAHRARIALLLELDDDADRGGLTAAAPVRALLIAAAERTLAALGVDDAPARSTDLVGLIDALVLYRSLKIGPVEARPTLHAYLSGLPKRP